MAGVYTVTQINSYIKNMFKQDFVLNHIQIKGEISNCKYHTSGHIYFTLKDSGGTISSIMFSSFAGKLKMRLTDGMKVTVEGRIDVYERDGKYQLYASNITEDGIGDLYKQFELLKCKFEEMGYFSDIYKKTIPAFSRKIGIVTASTGAAIRDIMNISYRRNPYVKLYLYPALVQGEQAKYSIVKGIEILDKMGLDCIIVGRGGGSLEDLWAFNEEIVAEAIFNAETPIISAVGHETDFSISDFVADLRAPTPSAAAELAVCDIRQVEAGITDIKNRLNRNMQLKIRACRDYTDKYNLSLQYLNPVNQVQEKRQMLIGYEDKLNFYMNNTLNINKHRLSVLSAKLDGNSPLRKLNGGFAYIQNHDGKHIVSVNDVSVNDNMDIYLKDGCVSAVVTGIDKNN
ncbi:MAG: exodeoxyribonuclease VII large subunit [Eubacteriales bacterium]|nr:exodeoxyribonuclease VII large subunit [Eubacteriales bacterium]